MATAGPLAAAVARRFVPARVRVVEVWPGTTLGGVVFASYEAGSSLVYRELNLVCALVRHGRSVGFWLPQLYVDSAESREDGRRIWGLPKELAAFDGAERDARAIDVRGSDGAAYRLQRSRAPLRFPVWMPVPFLSERDGELLSTWGSLRASVGFARVRVAVASDAFAALGFERAPLGAFLHSFSLVIPAPRSVT